MWNKLLCAKWLESYWALYFRIIQFFFVIFSSYFALCTALCAPLSSPAGCESSTLFISSVCARQTTLLGWKLLPSFSLENTPKREKKRARRGECKTQRRSERKKENEMNNDAIDRSVDPATYLYIQQFY